MTQPQPPADSADRPEIVIPARLLPADGRFGSGPSRVRQSALEGLAAAGPAFMGTSHRRPGVRSAVARVREGLAEMFGLPDGYEAILGNGGATAFWDAAAFGLIERASQHLSFGEFSAKFARAVAGVPHLEEPMILHAPYGTHPVPEPDDRYDLYALTHNETSTGVRMPAERVAGRGLTAVDATSAAGGIPVRPEEFDVYYFSPQKAFGGDGGLYVALCSPAALERIGSLAVSGRWTPPFLSLRNAVENSLRNQTYNTPALASIYILMESVEWINGNGGLSWSAGRCAENAAALYRWAEDHPLAFPFVEDPALRSPVTAAVDFQEAASAPALAALLRANGVVDVEPYRLLGRNQLRIGLWPAVPLSDVQALLACLDYLIERIAD